MSHTYPVIIFKYSDDCYSSKRLSLKLEEEITKKKLLDNIKIYLIIVQKQPALSENIAKRFDIKHESPQIIILNKGKVSYTAHHNNINIKEFVLNNNS